MSDASVGAGGGQLRRTAWRWLGLVLGLALLAGLVWMLVDRWQELPREALNPDWLQVLAAAGLLLASLGSSGLQWRRVVIALGEQISTKHAIYIHFICQPGKYLPGKVMLVMGKAVLAVRHGVSKRGVGVSVAYEQALFLLSGSLATLGFAAVASMDVIARHRPIIASFAGVSLVLLHPAVMLRVVGMLSRFSGVDAEGLVLSYRALLGLLAGFLLPWLLAGMGFFVFVDAVVPVDWRLLPDLAAIMALSGIVGLLALFAPAGVGVREAAMSAMLSVYMPLAVSLAVALAFRVVLIAVDLGALSIALVLQGDRRERAGEAS